MYLYILLNNIKNSKKYQIDILKMFLRCFFKAFKKHSERDSYELRDSYSYEISPKFFKDNW